jgi:hypothetical protein
MATIVIYKSPGAIVQGEAVEAWEDLAARLRDLQHDVRREDRYMKPGRVGVVFGEVVWIYLGVKATDVVTDHAIEGMLDRILDTVKAWGRERFRRRKDAPRPRPMSVQIADEDGNVLRSWRIDQKGEQETIPDDAPVTNGAGVNVHEVIPPAWEEVARRREPQVLLFVRMTDEGTYLRVDAFVAGQHRLVAHLTRLPGHIAVSPTPGRVVTFLVDEAESDTGIAVSAEGFRCEAAVSGDAELLLVSCYAEP